MRHKHIGLLALTLLILGGIFYTTPTAAAQEEQLCFDTGFCINSAFQGFWQRHDGLALFGAPVSEAREEVIEGTPRLVQWFERTRLELYPENDPPNDIAVGRLGLESLYLRGDNWEAFPKPDPTSIGLDCVLFRETGHSVCGEFLAAWFSYGLDRDNSRTSSRAESLALFGAPLSEARTERLANGEEYLVQWFERARFEFHPENEFPFRVLFGRLGTEMLRAQGRLQDAAEAQAEAERQAQAEAIRRQELLVFADPTAGNFRDSPTGNLPTQAAITVMRPDTSDRRQLTDGSALDWEPAWSPDGLRVAFSSNRTGNWDIFVVNLDGSGLTQLTDSPAAEVNPAWSPDGNRIVFASNRDATEKDPAANPEYIPDSDIYVINADGSNLTRLTDADGEDMQPVYSPDGGAIAFTSTREVTQAIYVMNADGSNAAPLANTDGRDGDPAWSPDGGRIAFVSMSKDYVRLPITPREGEVYLVEITGSTPLRITPADTGGRGPAFSPDGSAITFWSLRNGGAEANLFRMNLDGSDRTYLGSGAQPSWAK